MINTEYEKTLKKLEETCKENELEFTIKTMDFPITMSIKPDWEAKNQLRIDIGESNFMNGEIKFTFADELTITIINDFRIEDSILNKIKTQAKKIHYLYLQMYFKEKTKLTEGAM